jgi:hypothetical protein
MELPRPEQGLGVRYGYLWRRERRRGADEGRKDRPCVIMLVRAGRAQATAPRVMVVAMTHSQPGEGDVAIEVPARVRRALGLGGERSWVVLDEVNEFTWPGFDLRPLPGGRRKADYGFLPPLIFDRLRAALISAIEARQVGSVIRD